MFLSMLIRSVEWVGGVWAGDVDAWTGDNVIGS